MSYVLKAEGISRRVKDFQILKDVSFELKRGEIVGLIGPNGAGKTSIMKILVGLTRNYTGKVFLEGVSDIGSMIETPNFYPYETGYGNLMYFAGLNGVKPKKVEELLDLLGLMDAANRNVKAYSLGMRQRLGLAMSLLSKPEIMVLDEPINGLDPEGILDIRKMLAELAAKENMTILISSHILKELSALCTDYAIVREGTLIEELSAEELLAKTRSYVVMATNDINRTTAVLEEKLGIHEYKVTYDNEILIYERLDEIETLSKTVTDSGLIITRLNPEGESLEEYYIGKVGGDNE